jgi:hypothetical protein
VVRSIDSSVMTEVCLATMKDQDLTVIINRVGGDAIKFKVASDETRNRNLASNIEKAMTGQYVGVELDGKITLIPIHNVSSVEIFPAPSSLIAHVVRDAKRID